MRILVEVKSIKKLAAIEIEGYMINPHKYKVIKEGKLLKKWYEQKGINGYVYTDCVDEARCIPNKGEIFVVQPDNDIEKKMFAGFSTRQIIERELSSLKSLKDIISLLKESDWLQGRCFEFEATLSKEETNRIVKDTVREHQSIGWLPKGRNWDEYADGAKAKVYSEKKMSGCGVYYNNLTLLLEIPNHRSKYKKKMREVFASNFNGDRCNYPSVYIEDPVF